jgi:hypothetical protein
MNCVTCKPHPHLKETLNAGKNWTLSALTGSCRDGVKGSLCKIRHNTPVSHIMEAA